MIERFSANLDVVDWNRRSVASWLVFYRRVRRRGLLVYESFSSFQAVLLFWRVDLVWSCEDSSLIALCSDASNPCEWWAGYCRWGMSLEVIKKKVVKCSRFCVQYCVFRWCLPDVLLLSFSVHSGLGRLLSHVVFLVWFLSWWEVQAEGEQWHDPSLPWVSSELDLPQNSRSLQLSASQRGRGTQ